MKLRALTEFAVLTTIPICISEVIIMLKSVIAASLLGISVLATCASAYTLVSYKEIPGVIASVDSQGKTITITTKEGELKTLPLSDTPKVATVNGHSLSLASLSAGDKVILKQRVNTPSNKEIKGKIISVNQADYSLRMRDYATNNIVAVKFEDDVRVAGADANSFANLRSGHELVVHQVAK